MKKKIFIGLLKKETYETMSMLAKDLGYSKGEIIDVVVQWYMEDCERGLEERQGRCKNV